MKKKNSKESLVPIEVIQNKIYVLRDTEIMIDRDLAELYGVETRRLNEAVKRNINRFKGYIFQLNKSEFNNLKSQIATSKFTNRN